MKVRTKGEPAPIVVPLPGGASITLRPWASGAMSAAMDAFSRVLAAGGSRADATVAFTAAAAVWAALSWSGISDEDDEAGAPLEMTDELVEALIVQQPGAFTAIDQLYVIPALDREAEKNGSAPSPAGGTPAGAPTVN